MQNVTGCCSFTFSSKKIYLNWEKESQIFDIWITENLQNLAGQILFSKILQDRTDVLTASAYQLKSKQKSFICEIFCRKLLLSTLNWFFGQNMYVCIYVFALETTKTWIEVIMKNLFLTHMNITYTWTFFWITQQTKTL